MTYKELLSGLAIVLTVVVYLPYIRAIVQGSVKPHLFSWVIWGMTTFVVFLAQLAGKGGAGAWPTGFSGVMTIFIAVLAYRKTAEVTITRSDWLFFGVALSALPFWYFTADPLWAVVILTVVDILGFGPTVRKAYADPASESLQFYGLFSVRNVIAMLALEHYSVTTVLFPATITVACVMLMIVMVQRTKALAAEVR